MSLAKKYRPTKLDEVIGNENIITSLQNFSTNKTKPHTYLFTGPYGCGKTTLASIYANLLGCTNDNIIELNMSSKNGVDDIRELEQEVPKVSMFSPIKVFILDEVHQLTKAAQSAILKVIDSLPKDVYFILCTTEPKKLLSPVRSRCHTLEVKKPTIGLLIRHMNKILKAENRTVSNEILNLIAEKSECHIRDALELLTAVLSVDEESQKEVIFSLDKDDKNMIELCKLLLNGANWLQLIPYVKSITDDEVEGYRRMILNYMKSVLLKGYNERAILIISKFKNNFFDSGVSGFICALLEK